MAHFKLFRLVSVLRKEELNDVEKLLKSTFFKSNADTCELFRQLCKFYPGLDDSKLTKEFLFRRVYGKIPYDDGKMRKLMTRLTQLLEQYLVVKEVSESNAAFSQALISSLAQRSDYQLFMEAAEHRLKALENRVERGREYFRESAQVYQSVFFHPETAKFTTSHNYFNYYLSNFERYFLLSTLQNGTERIIQQRIVPGEFNMLFLESAAAIAGSEELQFHSVIDLFYRLFKMYQSPGISVDFEDLKQLLDDSFSQMGDYEQRMAIKLLISYAIPFYNTGSSEHAHFIFELYKRGVELRLVFMGDNALNTDLFMNIAAFASSTGNLKWAKNFIEENERFLVEEDREPALQFSLATYYYYSGIANYRLVHFENAIKALNLIPVKSRPKFELRARFLLIRAKYELLVRNEISLDDFLTVARNYERHIAGNQTYSERIKNSYARFIHHFKILARLANNPNLNMEAVEQFLQNLENDEVCIQKNWLKEKAKELI